MQNHPQLEAPSLNGVVGTELLFPLMLRIRIDLHRAAPPFISQRGCFLLRVSQEPHLKLLFNHTSLSPILCSTSCCFKIPYLFVYLFVSLTRM